MAHPLATTTPSTFWDRKAPLLLYALAAILLLAFSSRIPLERNQEARVLETAREMVHQPLEAKLVPHLNGQVRLQKPPLAYWLATISFYLLGTGTWQGRLPMALSGLLTLIFTVRIARRLLSPRAAFFAGALLLSSFAFLKYARLAETDILTTLFLTAAIEPLLHLSPFHPPFSILHPRPSILSHHLFAAAVALAAIAKGPPALFPLILLVTWSLITRPRLLIEFLNSGATLTLILIAAPWWLYARHRPEWHIIEQELDDLRTGRDHFGALYLTPAFVLKAALPWTPLLLLALCASLRHLRSRPILFLLIWCASIFVPLAILPQKQEHYILPLLPPLFILTAWMIDRALSPLDPPLTNAVAWTLGATTVAALAAPPALLVIAHNSRHQLFPLDYAAATFILVSTLSLFLIYHRKGLAAALVAATVSGIVDLSIVMTFWLPSLHPTTFTSIARDITRDYGQGPYALYPIDNYRLNFELRQIIPVYPTLSQIPLNPNLVILSEQDPKSPPPPPPFPLRHEYPMPGKTIRIYTQR